MPVAWSQSKGLPPSPLESRGGSATMEACIFCVLRVNSFLAKLLCPAKLSSKNSNEIRRVSSLSMQYLGRADTSCVRGVWGDLSEEMSAERKNLKTVQFFNWKINTVTHLKFWLEIFFTALLKIGIRILFSYWAYWLVFSNNISA